ncbi:MAG: PKD domain-containing protein [Taibaiella sp.]|nr:PKD domain-containing protein [Taibaiella sp.]
MNYRPFLLILLLSITATQLHAKKVRALFLGNSYTDYNNLPELVKQLALSAGDTLEYSKNTPGGYTLEGHSTNSTSLNLIQAGNWDYVVLQEQSQRPAFSDAQVASEVYPYARKLDSLIKLSNPCAATLFYMTWGRKNGDAGNCPFLPEICTYEGMDSLLQLRYTIMAQDNNASVSPVAKVWRSLRENHPNIELYIADESHPSNNGSFAAACTFYAMLFGKDPVATSYNFTVNAADAAIIKNTSKTIVFDSLSFWNRFDDLPAAQFTSTLNGATASFTNQSLNASQYTWDFGDGNSSSLAAPSHTYTSNGTYIVTLTAKEADCNHTSTFMDTLQVSGATSIKPQEGETTFKPEIFPNPVRNELFIRSQQALAGIKIWDVNGRMALQPELVHQSATQYRSDIGHLPAGLFLVQVIARDGQQYLLKILK